MPQTLNYIFLCLFSLDSSEYLFISWNEEKFQTATLEYIYALYILFPDITNSPGTKKECKEIGGLDKKILAREEATWIYDVLNLCSALHTEQLADGMFTDTFWTESLLLGLAFSSEHTKQMRPWRQMYDDSGERQAFTFFQGQMGF